MEAAYYHALARGFDHRARARFKKQYGTWEEAWGANSPGAEKLRPKEEFERLQEAGIRLVLLEEAGYPALLKEIPHPPLAVYYRGKLPANPHAAAIVGTRKASGAGRDTAYKFGEGLSLAGITIVSGLALGIDAEAHRGALAGDGGTCAVLPCGLDMIYPPAHRKLARTILESGGALVSEHPPGTPLYPCRFLERNRIVSGLCRGVVIIEAPRRSGALVTARFALDQDREILVTPGAAGDPNYEGSHRLIRDGARLVARPEEAMEDLGFAAPSSSADAPAVVPEADRVLKVFRRSKTPLSIDEIVQNTKLTSSEASRAVTLLMIQNVILEDAAGNYKLKRPCNS